MSYYRLFLFYQYFMTDIVVSYIIIGVLAVLVIFSFSIWSEKMIKIILWNYILGILCLAANQSINILVNFLNTTPYSKIIWIQFGNISTFLADSKMWIVLVLYILFLLLLYYKSKIRVNLSDDEILKRSIYLILVPLCVMSIILTLEIVILGIDSINLQILQKLANWLTTNVYLHGFITMTPVWILIHGIATVLITTEIKMNIKTDF